MTASGVMRILFISLLLVLLSASALSRDADIRRRYKKFQRQHINKEMSANKCDEVMQGRKIAKTNKNKCKKINTFIVDDIDPVRAVCVKGEPHGNMTKSRQCFDIVVCTLKSPRAKYPNCEYRGDKLHKKIIIKCVNGFPVHYDGDIGHCDY
ncbi:ribonuclease-like 3 [Chelmon rostratus]|uniref:ribonuclease-like 3 n=1 Tax=Chelmon rostratus TaxID=109905 RepID=UPI001BE77E59|nr:ribonuclease-like 3 [Chelmon rostratus]